MDIQKECLKFVFPSIFAKVVIPPTTADEWLYNYAAENVIAPDDVIYFLFYENSQDSENENAYGRGVVMGMRALPHKDWEWRPTNPVGEVVVQPVQFRDPDHYHSCGVADEPR